MWLGISPILIPVRRAPAVMLVEFPPKPKGMHWRRYYRLKAAHDRAANCSFGVLAGYIRGLRARTQRY
jgi:hypothetical protein